jgi:tripartite-type tricarboxylate transporter receptor subunit TctC
VLLIALLFAVLGLPASAPAQPAIEDFYKGKQINVIVGYGPGGGYDVVARLLARHLGRYVAPAACAPPTTSTRSRPRTAPRSVSSAATCR